MMRPAADSEFVQLNRRFRPALMAFFLRRLHNHAEAEDLTQEVFARLMAMPEVRLSQADAYIFQIAANLLRERARLRERRPEDIHDPQSDEFAGRSEEFSPERILLGREAYARMIEALQELPERVRAIFVLNRFEELSAAEIARRLGVSVSTVEKDMMRAVAHLRARLA